MFLAFREQVAAALEDGLAALDLPTGDLGIEEPPADVDAVLASSVAFRLAGEVGAPPPEVAGDLADAVTVDGREYLGSVTAQGPYVNFTPSAAFYRDTVAAACDPGWGRLPDTGDRVVVEHTSANPTGPIHVGRARNPIVGDALARLLDYAGDDVERHYYVNDAGRQMAVFAWAYEHFDESDLPEPERDRPDFDLVRYYRAGNELLEEGDPADVEAAETEIQSVLQGLEEGDDAAFERVERVAEEMLAGMRLTLERLPASFDEFVHETAFMREGATDEVVAELKDSPHAVYEDDAWQLDLEAYGIEKNFVFLRSDGTSLYTTRDLAHHRWKFREFDRAVTVLGEDQKLHASQLRAALAELGEDTDQLTSVFYGWVNLPGGESMSTRAGTGVDLDDLLDEAEARARAELERRLADRQRDDDLTDADVDRIARQVGIGAVRYDIVAKQRNKEITFDWDEALDFEAQSAPYVQYAHARACGILADATVDPDPDVGLLDSPAERRLLRQVARLPRVVEHAAGELEPHHVATYTRELADAFNTFYRECPVLSADDDDLRAARLALVDAARQTLANSLSLLGVEAPESM